MDMQVKILPGQKRAVDRNGRNFRINGIRISLEKGGTRFYPITDPFYKAAAAEGTKSEAILVAQNIIDLI